MYILNIINATKRMTIKQVRDFIFENDYKRVAYRKENSYYSMKR